MAKIKTSTPRRQDYVSMIQEAHKLLKDRPGEAAELLFDAADAMVGHPERERVLGWAREAENEYWSVVAALMRDLDSEATPLPESA